MLNPADLPLLAAKTLTLRGKPITVRALSCAESRAIDKQCPLPEPPGTTEAQREVERKHPWFKEKYTAALALRRMVIAAAGSGLTNAAGEEWSSQRDGDWCKKLGEHMEDHLSESEIMTLYLTVSRLPEDAVADAAAVIGTGKTPGNS